MSVMAIFHQLTLLANDADSKTMNYQLVLQFSANSASFSSNVGRSAVLLEVDGSKIVCAFCFRLLRNGMVAFRELRPMLAGEMLAMARRAKGKTAAVLHTGKANFLGTRTADSKSW
jgi:hypothetical protein